MVRAMSMKPGLFAVSLLILAGCADKKVISQGDRVGVVTELSHKKMGFCGGKWNWEGELAMQGGTIAAGREGEPSPIWQFSLDPQAKDTERMVSSLRGAMNSGHTVRITYSQVAAHGCDTQTDYLVSDVLDLAIFPQ